MSSRQTYHVLAALCQVYGHDCLFLHTPQRCARSTCTSSWPRTHLTSPTLTCRSTRRATVPSGPTCYTSCASCPTTPSHDPYEGVAKAQRTERKNQNREEASASSNLEEIWGRHAAAEATNRREDPRRLRAFRVPTTQALDVFCGDCAGIIGP